MAHPAVVPLEVRRHPSAPRGCSASAGTVPRSVAATPTAGLTARGWVATTHWSCAGFRLATPNGWPPARTSAWSTIALPGGLIVSPRRGDVSAWDDVWRGSVPTISSW